MAKSLVSKLSKDEEQLRRFQLQCISPDDAKYGKTSRLLSKYLSAEAEWGACAYVQRTLLETRIAFGKAEQIDLDKIDKALELFDPLNVTLLEENSQKEGGTRHDQLAVIKEMGNEELLHPGTTSYDILDTARSYLFKGAWKEVIRPEIIRAIRKFSDMAERFVEADERALENGKRMPYLQKGRTHLQDTSPVPFGVTLAGYAERLASRVERCDFYFNDLRGKISGIVGTGASIDMVICEGESLNFELTALNKLDLKPDIAATQVVQKERLADVGHGLTSLMFVLRDFANDMRILYSSAIGEVTSRDNAERLGGSSADATKNNPIEYENLRGKAIIVGSGMPILYDMIVSDLQRDLSSSVEARYQPQQMMVQTYEAFFRLNKSLDQLFVNEDKMAENLENVRKNPSEAMVAILRGEKWVHSNYGVGHDFVKEIGKIAKKNDKPLLAVALEDLEFRNFYEKLPDNKKDILAGKLEKYVGSAFQRARKNISYAKSI
ncbi:MAG: lyase family protein [archaeon]